MSLQDYIGLVNDSFDSFFYGKSLVLIPFIAALTIFIVGLLVATVLKILWIEIAKFLNLEKSFLKIDSYSSLVKSNKNLSVTELLGSLIWWSLVLIFLFSALKALNFYQIDLVLNQLLGYLPFAVVGGLYLFLGSIFAWFAFLLFSAVGTLTKIPGSITIARLVATSIIVFSVLGALTAFGISSEFIRYIIFAVLAASALAFGLVGKDLATDILKKARDTIK